LSEAAEPGDRVPEAAERRLLREVRAGRREACAALVHEHYARVYRFLLHLTRDVHQAEDLTQETFAAAWKKIGTFEGRSALSTWLHRIAYGKFVDEQRSRQRTAALAGTLATRGQEASAAPFEVVSAEDEARNLYETLGQLDAGDRVVLALHYFQALSYRDMAVVLGEPAGTVKWRTSQALARLRVLLGAEAKTDE
jgi:RNA polymerase sigma-70 factor (ECF subfamily)